MIITFYNGINTTANIDTNSKFFSSKTFPVYSNDIFPHFLPFSISSSLFVISLPPLSPSPAPPFSKYLSRYFSILLKTKTRYFDYLKKQTFERKNPFERNGEPFHSICKHEICYMVCNNHEAPSRTSFNEDQACCKWCITRAQYIQLQCMKLNMEWNHCDNEGLLVMSCNNPNRTEAKSRVEMNWKSSE